METYLEKLLSQIRCKKARPYIAEEIRDHIECQIADNLSEGMTSEEAEKNAVADMGDPVEVGISLDRIHKPKIAWRLLVIVGILSLLGILIQQSILRQPGYQELETWRQEVYRYTTETRNFWKLRPFRPLKMSAAQGFARVRISQFHIVLACFSCILPEQGLHLRYTESCPRGRRCDTRNVVFPKGT